MSDDGLIFHAIVEDGSNFNNVIFDELFYLRSDAEEYTAQAVERWRLRDPDNAVGKIHGNACEITIRVRSIM